MTKRGVIEATAVCSHSRLSNFENCPKKFEYRYILEIPAESEGIEGFMGKRVHEVLERLYLAVERGHVPSLEQVIRRYRLLWDEHYDAERIRIVRRENPPKFYRINGERCLTAYYRRHYPFEGDETLGIEHRVEFPLDEAGEYRMQGVIDRVVRARDGALEVHDYKTSARTPPQTVIDRDRQLALYEIGLRQELNEQGPVRLVWHYLQHDRICTSTRSTEQLQSLRKKTTDLIDRIREESDWEPRTGPLCRWCEYSQRCPAVGGGSRVVAQDDPPHAPAASEASDPVQQSARPPGRGQLDLL